MNSCKDCKFFEQCGFVKELGLRTFNCFHFRHKDEIRVVRCKDCKHWKFIDSLNPYWECQIFYGLHECGYLTGADDFCSKGERRTDV